MTSGLPRKGLNALRVLASRRLEIHFDGIPHEFENVPLLKLLNWLLVEFSAVLRPPKAWGRPTHLQVEPSSLCDLQCSFCPVTTGLQRPTGLMFFYIFRKVFDEIA